MKTKDTNSRPFLPPKEEETSLAVIQVGNDCTICPRLKMNFRKPDNTTDLIDSIINSENGKVQKYVLERKRKEKEFLEKRENIKKKTLMAPKLNQMFVKNKNEDDKLISETVGLRTVHEYKKIKDKIFSNKEDTELSESVKESKYSAQKNFKLSFCSDEEEEEEEAGAEEADKVNNTSEENETGETDKPENKLPRLTHQNGTSDEAERETNRVDGNVQKDDGKAEKEEETKGEALQNNEKTNKIVNNKINFKKVMKDPTVNTSFLKDKDRDEKIEKKKKELRDLYFKLENDQKEKVIEITYSYYDGYGHRRKISVKQKTTIGQFINKCVDKLKNEFIHLRSASCETLMFVKEDIILPNYLTFYELIKNKAQGKTGPLFAFDAVENLSGITDIRREKTDVRISRTTCVDSQQRRRKTSEKKSEKKSEKRAKNERKTNLRHAYVYACYMLAKNM
ncbi:XAP-5 DNA binding protein, putative [Plasmodium ovale wallikeri]|uniref:XAP-5 DNA binding protein, putative n=1 Tax=Plasmodium ovale wallikeri TaxID=864142 RepID=A0A1A8YXZ5_PLAOA|nr:XAP-5 DNA binding protein, putative [Plasmodium ovale wallikeri]